MLMSQEKIGIALSGGGFRASFFHVGVLARLAEQKLLRRVEVISAVSGGAIIAALYYVHVKKLLEEKPDAAIRDDDYVTIVQRIEKDFLAAVQKNIRTRAFSNPVKNLRMALANYSRSDRLGELYDQLLYRPVLAPNGTKPIEMRELLIHPHDGPVDFHPRRHNEHRNAKAPILVLNATALNTGHNWRFEAARMGEAVRSGDMWDEVDKNMRLARPPSYDAITMCQQNIELGLAVAASACVPGLFAPLAISGLYDRKVRVQLVDGGVHDNQGVQALLDEGCTRFVISDASGQMRDEKDSTGGDLAVVMRANEILMDRVREGQLQALLGANGTASAFVHLQKGIRPETIGWIDRNERSIAQDGNGSAAMTSKRFGVDPEVQARLARIRTDLDSFTEIEAGSLMLDAYLMSGPELERVFGSDAAAPAADWGFLRLRAWMRRPTPAYLRHLEVGQSKVCKVYRLSWTTTVTAALLVVAAAYAVWHWQTETVVGAFNATISVKTIVGMVLTLALGFVPIASRSFKVLRFLRAPSEWALRTALRGVLPALGSLFVWIELHVLDRLFLRLGRIATLAPPEHADTPLPEEEDSAPTTLKRPFVEDRAAT